MSTTVSQPPMSDNEPGRRTLIGFRRDLRVEISRGDQVYLFSEQGLTSLEGTATAAVASLLDGTHELAALLARPPAGLTAAQVAATISRLTEEGMVTLRPPEAGRAHDDGAAGYWEGAGLDATEATERTAGGRLAVLAIGGIDPAPLRAALGAAGLTIDAGDDPASADLSIVLCEDYLNPLLAEIDTAQRATGTPWLLAKPTGAVTWFGPVFQPSLPGCWHCVAKRLAGHRRAESCAQHALGHPGPVDRPQVSVPPLAAASAHLIALEATKWLAGYRRPDQSGVHTFDSLTLSIRHHVLPVSPQCAHCGDPNLIRARTRRPVILGRCPKSADSAGGYRARSAEETFAAYGHLVSPVTGIVPDIRRAEYGPRFFNSFRSGPNVAARGTDFSGLRAAMRMENGGKGTTEAQARMSALGEAVERYCGSFHGDEEIVSGSLRSLGERAVHPNSCQLFAEHQFTERQSWNERHSTFQYVPPRFDENAVLNWTPVWSLTQSRHRLLPTELLYFGSPAQAMLCADSNGNAAGASLADAVLQGLLELVERDAVALWWYNRDRVPGIDLAAFDDPWNAQAREVYAGLGRSVWALDLTSDLGVPTVVACSASETDGRDVLFGFGAHLDPRIALRRALTEMNQLMPALLAARHTGTAPCDDPDAARWFDGVTVAEQPYLRADPGRRLLGPGDYDWTSGEDIVEDIDLIRHRLEALGMEMLVLDQTRPDVGLPVAKVIVPGLRHFWRRLAPGRLFDTPVHLGRRAVAQHHGELNPIPMFL